MGKTAHFRVPKSKKLAKKINFFQNRKIDFFDFWGKILGLCDPKICGFGHYLGVGGVQGWV